MSESGPGWSIEENPSPSPNSVVGPGGQVLTINTGGRRKMMPDWNPEDGLDFEIYIPIKIRKL